MDKNTRSFFSIRLKRAYETPDQTDGYRILVDRFWPRGIKKERAHIDLWIKDIAPSNELRTWYHQEPQKWAEFRERYYQELDSHSDLVDFIWHKLGETGKVTFVFSSKDEDHNNAVVLKDYLVQRIR